MSMQSLLINQYFPLAKVEPNLFWGKTVPQWEMRIDDFREGQAGAELCQAHAKFD